jgi:hypothetical protein
MKKKHITLLVIIFLFVTLAGAAIKAYSYYQEYKGFIEVCDHGIVYVPKGTKFVKCHGIVRSVIMFENSATDDEDCACLDYKCCDGLCYVFVMTGLEEYDSESKTEDGSIEYRKENIDRDIIKMWILC